MVASPLCQQEFVSGYQSDQGIVLILLAGILCKKHETFSSTAMTCTAANGGKTLASSLEADLSLRHKAAGLLAADRSAMSKQSPDFSHLVEDRLEAIAALRELRVREKHAMSAARKLQGEVARMPLDSLLFRQKTLELERAQTELSRIHETLFDHESTMARTNWLVHLLEGDVAAG